jgi:hypothetical protein
LIMETELSAVVILQNGDVHSVYVVPATEAMHQHLSVLRKQVRESVCNDDIRIQCVPCINANGSVQVQGFEEIKHKLSEIIDSGGY